MNKLLKLAKFGDQPELTQFNTILDLEEKVDSLTEEVKNIKFPEQIDYSEQIEQIIAKLDEEDDDEEIVVTLNII